MREYSNYDIKVYQKVISLYKSGFKPTYKLICLAKSVPFIEFRKYVKEKYGYDPDDKDVEFSNNLLNKGRREFLKYFIDPFNSIYADYNSINLYIDMYKVIKDKKLNIHNRRLYSTLNSIDPKKFNNKSTIDKLRARYSLFSSIPIS